MEQEYMDLVTQEDWDAYRWEMAYTNWQRTLERWEQIGWSASVHVEPDDDCWMFEAKWRLRSRNVLIRVYHGKYAIITKDGLPYTPPKYVLDLIERTCNKSLEE